MFAVGDIMWRKFPDDDTFFSIMQAHGLKLRRSMACSSQGKYQGEKEMAKMEEEALYYTII